MDENDYQNFLNIGIQRKNEVMQQANRSIKKLSIILEMCEEMQMQFISEANRKDITYSPNNSQIGEIKGWIDSLQTAVDKLQSMDINLDSLYGDAGHIIEIIDDILQLIESNLTIVRNNFMRINLELFSDAISSKYNLNENQEIAQEEQEGVEPGDN